LLGVNGLDDYEPRPVKYSKADVDDRLIFLGKYDVDWTNRSSYKCFFKYNDGDKLSKNLYNNTDNTGTATWVCKEVVVRIFKGYDNDKDEFLYTKPVEGTTTLSNIEKKICEYIYSNELEHGTKHIDGSALTLKTIENFWSEYREHIGKPDSDEYLEIFEGTAAYPYIKFGGKIARRYDKAKNVYFSAGIEYKLGGIQVLLSPDIFSVAEMKMYNYGNTTNNKVFIGEWNKDQQSLSYYGAGTIKTSDFIDVSSANANCIIWKHNFNIPPKYLDVQLFARFTIDFGSFCAGDVITNLVNINREPLSMRLTGTDVMLNISNGVCFTDPETGEFMSFHNGFGIQMDRPGNFDALKSAQDVGANIISADSFVAAKIEAAEPGKPDSYPFRIYFVVKRLF
jgi:hypothetical protein